MKSQHHVWLGALAALLIAPVTSHAYGVRLQGQALLGADPDVVTFDVLEDNGVTSASRDTGVATSSQGGGGTASAFASVDIATGEIKLSGSAEGFAVATAYANFNDTLSFVLAPGVTSATIGFVMDVEGSLGSGAGGISKIQLGGTSVSTIPPGGPNPNNPLGRLRGEVTILGNTDLALFAEVRATCLSSPCFFDLANTASIALEPLPEGVTFTSESGVFTSVIPLPAGVWLFGSALGLLGWVKRKTT